MKKVSANAKRVAKIFSTQGALLSAEMLIKSGVNPIYAWFHVKGIDPKVMLERTSLYHRLTSGWPTGLAKPTPELLMDWVLMPQSEDDPKQPKIKDLPEGPTHIPAVSMDWKGIFDACVILGVTPDKFMPRNSTVYSKKFVTEPAPAEFVEAGIYLYYELQKIGEPRSLLNFLIAECQKADVLGYRRVFPKFLANEEYLSNAESVYYANHDNVEILKGDKPPKFSPVHVMREQLDAACIYYERSLHDRVRQLAREIEAMKKGYEHHLSIIRECASAVAPMGQGPAWHRAFNENKEKIGFDEAIDEVLAKPSAFHPVRQFLDSATTVLSDGRTLKGLRIVEAFCQAYRDYLRCVAKAGPKKVEAKEKDLEEALDRWADFVTWRRAPQVQLYLQAVAASRVIEHEMGAWVPSPSLRQTPRIQAPVLRGAKTVPPRVN
ncbi:MAG: hypothetical protein KGQ41_03945 [Alphaproteobacteria bacterium]|nr:hypothetical protein [Alphaproteobacteria bacterium]